MDVTADELEYHMYRLVYVSGELVRLSRAGTQYKLFGDHTPGKVCAPTAYWCLLVPIGVEDDRPLTPLTPFWYTQPLVVCVHGINTANFQFMPLAKDLAMSGHWVLTYDLYGRGGSGDPNCDHDLPLFVGQLAELLYHIQNVHNQSFKVSWRL